MDVPCFLLGAIVVPERLHPKQVSACAGVASLSCCNLCAEMVARSVDCLSECASQYLKAPAVMWSWLACCPLSDEPPKTARAKKPQKSRS